jgi:hypothetical protein
MTSRDATANVVDQNDYSTYDALLSDDDRYRNCRNCGSRLLSNGDNAHVDPMADLLCDRPEQSPTYRGGGDGRNEQAEAPAAAGEVATVIGTRPARATYRNHGRPASAFYLGDGKEPAGIGARLARFEADGSAVMVVDIATGEHLATHTARTRFWSAPAETIDANELRKARIDAAHVEAREVAEIRRMTSNRVADMGPGLRWSSLRHAQHVAAAAGQGALAYALAERVAEATPAYEADREQIERDMAEQRARVIAQRAAEAPADEIVIVPCGGKKVGTAAPAGEMYVGSYHRAARRAAEAHGGRVLILSAKYGLLPLDRVIGPYELRMGQPGSVTAGDVAGQAFALGVLGASRVTVFAGRAYADVVAAVWPHAKRPLDGTRGIGEQLARMAGYAGTARQCRPVPAEQRRPAPTAPTPEAPGQLDIFAAAVDVAPADRARLARQAPADARPMPAAWRNQAGRPRQAGPRPPAQLGQLELFGTPEAAGAWSWNAGGTGQSHDSAPSAGDPLAPAPAGNVVPASLTSGAVPGARRHLVVVA